jgi:hypothetical protein
MRKSSTETDCGADSGFPTLTLAPAPGSGIPLSWVGCRGPLLLPEVLLKARDPIANGAADLGVARAAASNAKSLQCPRAHPQKVGGGAGVEYGRGLSAAGFFSGFGAHA